MYSLQTASCRRTIDCSRSWIWSDTGKHSATQSEFITVKEKLLRLSRVDLSLQHMWGNFVSVESLAFSLVNPGGAACEPFYLSESWRCGGATLHITSSRFSTCSYEHMGKAKPGKKRKRGVNISRLSTLCSRTLGQRGNNSSWNQNLLLIAGRVREIKI